MTPGTALSFLGAIRSATMVVALLLLGAFAEARPEAQESRICFPGTHLDGHTHMGFSSLEGGEIDTSSLEYLTDRCLCAVVFVMPVDRSETEDLEDRLAREIESLQDLARATHRFALASTPSEVREGCTEGNLSVLLSLEYFDGLFHQDPSTVGRLAELGIVAITLVNNSHDPLMIDSAGAARLTDLGRLIISKMNDAGVLVDISHLDEQQMLAAIAFSAGPVIASHSNPRGAGSGSSPLSDRVIDAIAAKEGLILVSFNANDLYRKEEPRDDGVRRLVEHLEYLRSRIGIEHIGIGTDLQAFGRYVPEELNRVGVMNSIRTALKSRGYCDSEIEAIFGENFLRTWSEAQID